VDLDSYTVAEPVDEAVSTPVSLDVAAVAMNSEAVFLDLTNDSRLSIREFRPWMDVILFCQLVFPGVHLVDPITFHLD
jgi:hypothetical protein